MHFVDIQIRRAGEKMCVCNAICLNIYCCDADFYLRIRMTLIEVTKPVVLFILMGHSFVYADTLVGEGPRFKPEFRITQEQITNGSLSLKQIRQAGLRVFTTPFNKEDGHGDGVHDPFVADNRSAYKGNRPTLQGNGSFLRVNGLDSQACLECHTIVSNRTIPATLGIGGVGGINSSPMAQPDRINVADNDFDGVAEFTGRLINPPFLFGSGGVELLAKEMTEELQALKQKALDYPNQDVSLKTKGVSFGSIRANDEGKLDMSCVEGIDHDLIVKPFGRKGSFPTVRAFDIDALVFHLGMQATEAFGGAYNDADNDGVVNEISEGDLSALSIFLTTLERPVEHHQEDNAAGLALFDKIGCTHCHRRSLRTNSQKLSYKLTALYKPHSHVFYETDLSQEPARFEKEGEGLVVALFSDLKRHDMGERLAETLTLVSEKKNRQFITPRLWGIADTAPYLHDGRAFTLVDAIMAHNNPGSEAAHVAQNFAALSTEEKNKVLTFLMSLRTPKEPAKDLLSHIENTDYQ